MSPSALCAALAFLAIAEAALPELLQAELEPVPEEDAENGGSFFPWQQGAAAAVDALGRPTVLLAQKKPVRQRVNGSTPTGMIHLGTPAVEMPVIFDTGSEKLVVKTWDTVRRELDMVDRSASGAIKPTSRLYDHNSSRTYVPQFMMHKGSKVPKRGFVAYGSGTAFTDEGKDTLSVAGLTLKNFTVAEITSDSLTVMHTRRGVSGVLGLQHMKNRSMGKSFYTLCRDKGAMTAFSYCRGAKKGSGTFIWGDTSTEGTRLPVVGQIHWAVSLADVKVPQPPGGAEKKPAADEPPAAPKERVFHRAVHLHTKNGGIIDAYAVAKYSSDASLTEEKQAPPSPGADAAGGAAGAAGGQGEEAASGEICPGGKCVTVIDTGSNIIAGPIASLRQIARQLDVKHDCSNLKQLPDLQMAIGGMQVSLPSSSYVMKLKLPPLVVVPRPKRDEGAAGLLLESEDGGEGGRHLNASLSREQLERRLHAHLHSNYGLDLRTVLEGGPARSLLAGQALCVPAFVPLDKETASGPLWVVGTPLFDRYYVRWSWPHQEESPSIFVHERKRARACREEAELPPHAGGLLRTEARPAAEGPGEPSPAEWDVAEVRYPHWATELKGL